MNKKYVSQVQAQKHLDILRRQGFAALETWPRDHSHDTFHRHQGQSSQCFDA